MNTLKHIKDRFDQDLEEAELEPLNECFVQYFVETGIDPKIQPVDSSRFCLCGTLRRPWVRLVKSVVTNT